MLTIEEIRVKCNDVFKIAGYNFNDYNIEIGINGRLTKTLGRCKYIWKNRAAETIIPTRLEFSKKFLEEATAASIDDVVKHECCHALVAIETQKRHGHDKVFKSMCSRVGTTCDKAYNNNAEYKVPLKERYKYVAICSCCGKVVSGYSRMCKTVKYPEYYISKCCDASLIIEQNW